MTEALHYLCSENKGADQLGSYHDAVDLGLSFCICKNQVFSRPGSYMKRCIDEFFRKASFFEYLIDKRILTLYMFCMNL